MAVALATVAIVSSSLWRPGIGADVAARRARVGALRADDAATAATSADDATMATVRADGVWRAPSAVVSDGSDAVRRPLRSHLHALPPALDRRAAPALWVRATPTRVAHAPLDGLHEPGGGRAPPTR